ncbi:MAG: PQQ-binding-like beta-propeller repeat protein [Acidobacteriota bacterium]|nr:PQQ-binding-like beta-propeller repeat protein [Acidobacteriota bacterium]
MAGWTGQDSGGHPTLRVIHLGSGKDLLTHRLARPALAPPLPRPTSGGLPRWSLLLAGDEIVTLDRDGRRLAGQVLDDPVYPRLWSLLSHPATLGRESGRLLLPFLAAQKLRPRDLEAETLSFDGRWLLAAGKRSFAAWRCRETRRGRIRCSRQWRQHLGGTVTAPARVAGETILVSCRDTFLYAFRRDNGHLLWRRATGRRLALTALVAGKLVITAVGDAEVQAFHLDTGQPAGALTLPAGEHLAAPPGLAGGYLLVATRTVPESVVRLRAYALSAKQEPGAEKESARR